jgi:hypothetical protein
MQINNIKFKALFKEIATNRDVWKISTVNTKDVDFLSFRQKSEWLQFTGLHDRHQTEIYEGDLLNWNDTVVEVVFEHGSYKALHDGNSDVILWYCIPDCEVIGSKFDKNVKI